MTRALFKKLFFVYILVFIFLLLSLGIVILLKRLPFDIDYSSSNPINSNAKKDDTNQDLDNLNYYLDISPSMIGLANGDYTLGYLSNALERVNSSLNNNKNYYLCSNEITAVKENELYDNMKSSEKMDSHYDRYENRDSDEDELIKINEIINSDIDLSKIFTDSYSDGNAFNTKDNINIIITDMNFFGQDNKLDVHNTKFNKFSNNLSSHINNSNIMIYNINSLFHGIINDDFISTGHQNIKSGNNYSFFVIIFSESDYYFSDFIENFESICTEEKVGLNRKYELQNDLMLGNHIININKDNYYKSNIIMLNNFNYDNKSIKKIEENEIGLRVVRKDDNKSSILIPIAPIILTGMQDKDSSSNIDITIDTTIDIFYQKYLEPVYRSYEGEDIVSFSEAFLKAFNNEDYLYHKLELYNNFSIDDDWKNQVIIDVGYQVKEIKFTIPTWVNEINSNSLGDGVQKVNIIEFVNDINKVKENSIMNDTKEYNKYLGNVIFYINY